jgi:hypothetical protein
MATVSQNGKFGVNVWWTVPETVTDGVAAQEAMLKHGFEKKDLPLPTRRAEVARAVYSFQDRRHKENRRVTEKAADDGAHVTYGILDREQAGEQVGFKQQTTVRLDKATDSVTAEGLLASEVLKAVDAYSGKVTDEDVRYFLRRVVKMCYGVAKRPSGGIYFIPSKFAGIVESAQGAMNELGSGARIYVERVMDGKEERANVFEAVEAEVGNQIEETLVAVGRIEKRSNSVQSQQAKLEELGELVEVYKGLLGEEAKWEGVAERIEEAVKVVAEKMQKLQQGTAASVVAAVQPVQAKGGSKVVDAAVAVLTKAGKTMAASELFNEAVKSGLYVSDAKDPFTSFFSVLSKAVAKGEKRLVRLGSRTWSLAA